MSKPMSWSMPSDKICEKLKKKDQQICELHYDVEIDFKTVDLKKLKVKELKKLSMIGAKIVRVVSKKVNLLTG